MRGTVHPAYRPAPRLIATFLAVVLATATFILAPVSAAAAEFRSGNAPSVSSNETIDDDLFIFGAEVDVRGDVTGDVIASAGDFNLSGSIAGSLNLAAATATIGGNVGRSVRIAGGEVTVTGEIGGDIVLLGGELTIESGGSVAGDVVVTGGDTTVLGPVRGEIRGSASELRINAEVGDDVRVSAEHVRLQSRARIGGDLNYRSRNEAVIDDRADVTGEIERREPSFLPWENANIWLLSAVFRLLCALIAGAVIVMVMPRSAAAVADALRATPLRTVVLGVLLVLFGPVLLALLMITFIGLPIAIIGVAFYFTALYLSQVFVGLAMGRIVLPRSWGDHGRGYNLLAMTIGVIVLGGLRLIPVPYLSWAIAAVTAILGFGALVLGLSRRGRPTLA
ncbi:MAG: hypothetical protein ACRDJH_24490 [Thermomicrobiales bacterium]